MSDPRLDSLVALAQHCWKGCHWRKDDNGPRPIREPLKHQHLEAHLAGSYGVGLAPIIPGHDTTRIAVLDFDSHQGDVPFDKMRELAQTVRDELLGHGIDALPFRSSGGKGIHLICLWPSPQDAYSARERLRLSLAQCGLKSGTKGVRYNEVEIFPKQDSVPADGFGNMFVLPWAGQSTQLDTGDFHSVTKPLAQPLQWPMSAPVEVLEHPLPPVKAPITAPAGSRLAEVRAALDAIPNDGVESADYDTWRNVLFAIHHATGGSDEGLALAHEWSARSAKYDPEFLDSRVWPYIDSERPNAITERTLFQLARAHEDPADDFDILPLLPEQTESIKSVVEEGGPSPSVSGSRFRVIPADEFSTRPSPEWIIKGVLPRAELVVVFGESGSGKSFWVLDLMCATAQGKPWRDCRVSPYASRIVYVAAEAAGGFRNRLVAYATFHELNLTELPLGIVDTAPNLLVIKDVRALIDEIKKFGKADVIVVDTLAQTTPGANENAGEDMGKVLGHCKAIHRATGAVVLLIHHAGKDLSKGARGWSGVRAAADAEIEISRTGEERLATITKQKDGSDGRKYPFKLTVVPIGQDKEGDVIDSCVVTHHDRETLVKHEPTGDNARLVWKAIHDIAELCGDVTVESAIGEALKHKPAIPGQRDQRRAKLIRGLESLAKDGLIEVNDGRILFLQ